MISNHSKILTLTQLIYTKFILFKLHHSKHLDSNSINLFQINAILNASFKNADYFSNDSDFTRLSHLFDFDFTGFLIYLIWI